MAEVTRGRAFDGGRLIVISGLISLIGLALTAIGLFTNTDRALYSWLAAWSFATAIALSALIFLLIGYAVNGTWMVVIRRLNETIVSVFPLLFVMFLPIAIGADYIYIWVEPTGVDDEHLQHLLHHKEPWLNLPFFIVRTCIYFAVFIGIAELFRAWSLRRDRGVNLRPNLDKERVAASALLPAVAICLTLGAFDWTMSLQPAWLSTMYGVYYFAGGFVAAMALLTLLAWAGHRSGKLDVIGRSHFHALGRMMLGFTVFWAYIAYFQAFLIKIANIPEEVTYYIARSNGGWYGVVWVLIIGHFLLPFLYLLPKNPKFRAAPMALVAGWILVMHYVDSYWMVIPVITPLQLDVSWLDLTALMAVAGGCVCFAALRLRGKSLLAYRDPKLEQSLEYRST